MLKRTVPSIPLLALVFVACTGLEGDSSSGAWSPFDERAARSARLCAASDPSGADSAEDRAVEDAFVRPTAGDTAVFNDRTRPTIRASVTGESPHLTFHATASDNVGVTHVEFRVDGVLVSTESSMPFSTSLDVEFLPNGAHELTATAFDLAGNHATSTVVFAVAHPFEVLLDNGGFEAGETGWVAVPSGTVGESMVRESALARTGFRHALLNGRGTTGHDALHQDVTIPEDATEAALAFWLQVTTNETVAAIKDTLVVQARDPDTGEVLATLGLFSNLDATPGYVQRSFDLGAFAGRTLRILFDGNENASLATSFAIDDVSVRMSKGPDVLPPRVSARALVSGSRVFYFADVSDDGFVGAVEFLVDGVSVGASTISFVRVVNLSSLSNGVHALVARARDKEGNVTDSAPVRFFVDQTSTQRVLNPSFELSTGWTSASTATSSSGMLSSAAQARTGNRFFIFWSDVGPVRHSLRQTVAIPPDATSAIFSYWLRIHDSGFSDGLARTYGSDGRRVLRGRGPCARVRGAALFALD